MMVDPFYAIPMLVMADFMIGDIATWANRRFDEVERKLLQPLPSCVYHQISHIRIIRNAYRDVYRDRYIP